MNKKQIFKALQNSVNDITPDIFEKVSQPNVVPQRTEDFFMKNNQIKNRTTKFVISFASIAAIITLFVGGGFYYKKNKVVTTISFDVNPSIEMTANEYDEILDVYALNDDGTEILKDLDFKNTDVTQAVNEVVDSLVNNGYIDEEKSSILMNIESIDDQKENQLSDNISLNIEENLSEKNIQPTIFNQHGKSDSSTAALAKQYNISANKMAFIKNITKNNPEINIEELTSLNIEEIKDLMKEKKVNLDEVVEQKNQNKEKNQGDDTKNQNTNQIREKVSENANEKAKENLDKSKNGVSSNQSDNAKEKITSNSIEKSKENLENPQEQVSSKQLEKTKETTNQIKEKESDNINEKAEENKNKVQERIQNIPKEKNNSKK